MVIFKSWSSLSSSKYSLPLQGIHFWLSYNLRNVCSFPHTVELEFGMTCFKESMVPEDPFTNSEQNNEQKDYPTWAGLTFILGNKNLTIGKAQSPVFMTTEVPLHPTFNLYENTYSSFWEGMHMSWVIFEHMQCIWLEELVNESIII